MKNSPETILRLAYREGLNEGLRTALGKPRDTEDVCVARCLSYLASAIEAATAVETGNTDSTEGESAAPSGETPK